MKWRAARCSDIEDNCGIKPFKLPGVRRLAYVTDRFSPNQEVPLVDGTCVNAQYGLIAYVVKPYEMYKYELFVRDCNQMGSKWQPIKFDVMHRLFLGKLPNLVLEYECEIEEIFDGRCLLNCKTKCKAIYFHPNIQSIDSIYPCQLIHDWGRRISLAIFNGLDKVGTMEDAQSIILSFTSIKRTLADMAYNQLNKKKLMDNIASLLAENKRMEARLNESLENAADAMNELSSKFGFDIEV